MPAIKISGLKKKFGNFYALKGIDLEINRNQVYGLLGPNGAGKTTLIYILSTLLTPTEGNVKILGLDVRKDAKEIRGKIGVCFGGSFFYYTMNAKEILKYYGMLQGMKKHQIKEKSDYLIKALGIEPFKNKEFFDLSTGMRQKIAIAKSLINDPEILFLDEPTAGLDVEVAINIRDFIIDLIDKTDITVTLTSHHLYEVEEMCKKMAILNQGRIVKEGDIKTIRTELKIPDIIHLYLSSYKDLGFIRKFPGVFNISISDGVFVSVDSGLKRVNNIIKELNKRKIQVKDMEIKKASLEDVFLNVIGQERGIPKRGDVHA